MKKIEGVYTALWTPTDAAGKLQENGLKELIEFGRRHGVSGFLAIGSTGEFPYLDVEARKYCLARTIEWASPLPVFANISDIRPGAVYDLAAFAGRSGAAGVALLPPYFFHFAQEDIVEWFLRAGEKTDLPMFLYNFPELTGNRIELETVAEIAGKMKVSGIKQSGGEFHFVEPLVKIGREKGFAVFTGSDGHLAEALKLGGAGCIGGFGNVMPDLMTTVYAAVKSGDADMFKRANEKLQRLLAEVSGLGFPLGVAAALEARRLPVGEPKTPISPATREKYRNVVTRLRAAFPEWEAEGKKS